MEIDVPLALVPCHNHAEVKPFLPYRFRASFASTLRTPQNTIPRLGVQLAVRKTQAVLVSWYASNPQRQAQYDEGVRIEPSLVCFRVTWEGGPKQRKERILALPKAEVQDIAGQWQ
jgi:hypothetical protein